MSVPEILRLSADESDPLRTQAIAFLCEQVYLCGPEAIERDMFIETRPQLYGLRQGDTLVGAAALTFMGNPETELTLIAIDPAWRGQYLGELLLAAMEAEAAAAGAAYLRAYPQTEAWGFFAGQGFEVHPDEDFAGFVAKRLPPVGVDIRGANL
ncbi:MAG TPA: GNAT family N-acetyltransferase [Candidatus Saccharimonadales bacterium]